VSRLVFPAVLVIYMVLDCFAIGKVTQVFKDITVKCDNRDLFSLVSTILVYFFSFLTRKFSIYAGY